LIIDIVLVIIIAIIALVASRFIPTDEAIKNNEAGPYKSKIKMIYVAGVGSIIVGVLLLVFYAIEEEYQLLINLGKIMFLMIIGIALINKNFKKSKTMAAFEGTVPAVSAPIAGTVEAEVVTPTTVATATPAVQPQARAAQVTTAQVVQAQPQTTVQPRAVAPAVQPQPKITQPRIVVIKCPKCQGAMQINTAMLGQKMKCPHCGVEGRIG
jgi:predicted RNA-binding Zn-ribbon protein involved in translation (DUF1610 family)